MALTIIVPRQGWSVEETTFAGGRTSDALDGGAASLSNLGHACVDGFSTVIPPSPSSILAIGAHDPLVTHPALKLCLSLDGRVRDGGPAAEFLGRLVSALEQPEVLV
jgi:pyruvate dehydrogenase E2 component (dihydrolipoyllysine-residue acetyltransferase)